MFLTISVDFLKRGWPKAGHGISVSEQETIECSMNLTGFFKKKSRLFSIILSFALIGIVGYVDYVTGREISFAIFYLIPICYITWYTGLQPGILASIVSALTWFFDEYTGTDLSVYPAIPYWNAAGMLGFFLVITYLLAELKEALEKDKKMAGTDYLTGAANLRSFTEMVNNEIGRGGKKEHPFSVAYVDIDNLKKFNGALGRSTGDELLRLVVKTIKSTIRKTDTITRLGGDEFVILMPETKCAHADAVVAKVKENLLQAMQMNNWPVTFSIGVVTFVTPPESVDDLIRTVDAIMINTKNSGKNEIRHEVVDKESTAA
jgi:diguanylate cyclase (GGDEF)-like protein